MLTAPTAALSKALASNRAWSAAQHASDASFLPTLAQGQAPAILWLGCSDSRVPETTILGLPPGAVFTHRNIANIITSTDLSALSVIEYAVAAVGVRHVVLCGHTACGGVAAALANKRIGVIDAWLAPLRRLRMGLAAELAGLGAEAANLRLVEANVAEGVKVLRANPNVLRAARDRGLLVHGAVYDLKTGLVRELAVEEGEAEVRAREASCMTE